MEIQEQTILKSQFDEWEKDPVAFIQFFWPNSFLWDKLEEICLSVKDNRGTVVPSGHGVGKSWISARVALWWLFTRYPSKVVTTAPTFTQVASVLWGEIRSALATSRIPLCEPKDILQTEIKLAPDWFAIGFSTSEKVSQREYGSTKMQGFHSPHLLVILDEAPGVDYSIHTAIETLATGENNRKLKIGNPTSPSGNFYENCYSDNWHKIQISCLDHPNVLEGREVIPGAVTKEWLDDRRLEWGEDSPLWKAKVLGLFPDETEDTLIPLSWCEQAIHAEVEPDDMCVLGVDAARFGDDLSVAYDIKASMAKLVFTSSKEDTMQLSGRITNTHELYKIIGIDGTGIGAGVVDRVREVFRTNPDLVEQQHKVKEIHFGSSPVHLERFADLRTEMAWNLRERLRPDAPKYLKLRLPKNDTLINQLAGLKIKYTSDGRMKLESKDEMKKRGLKSPDHADALMIAAWLARPIKPENVMQNPLYKELADYRRQQFRGPSVANRL